MPDETTGASNTGYVPPSQEPVLKQEAPPYVDPAYRSPEARPDERRDARTGEYEAPVKEAPKGKDGYAWHKVVLTHPNHNRKVVFRSLSEARARAFIEKRHPRGSEAFLEMPDGTTQSYEHERTGEQGIEDDHWKDFDPDSWMPVDQNAPPGEQAWSDKEG
jgi:hypothetical protein